MLGFLIFKDEYSFCGLRGNDDEWSISGYQCVTDSYYFHLRGRIRPVSLQNIKKVSNSDRLADTQLPDSRYTLTEAIYPAQVKN